MPTYETTPRFTHDLRRLSPAQRHAFHRVVTRAFIPDLRAGRFRAGLRIKRVRCSPGVYELTWAGNGRATWSYGTERIRGAQHIVWHRIGTHSILDRPLAEGRLAGQDERAVHSPRTRPGGEGHLPVQP